MQPSSKNLLVLSMSTACLVLDILGKIELRGSRNIIKSKIGRYLETETEDIKAEQRRLLQEHAFLDVNGKPLEINGQHRVRDPLAWKAAMEALVDENPIIIDGTTDTVRRAQIAFIREITSDDLCPPIHGQLGFAFEDLDAALTIALGA